MSDVDDLLKKLSDPRTRERLEYELSHLRGEHNYASQRKVDQIERILGETRVRPGHKIRGRGY